MALFSLDLALASRGGRSAASGGELLGIVAFLSRFAGLRIFVDLTLIAVCGGLFVVPLYAIIQRRSDEAARARTIAAMNIMNALFMTAAAAVTALLLSSALGTPDLWLDPGDPQRRRGAVDLPAAAAGRAAAAGAHRLAPGLPGRAAWGWSISRRPASGSSSCPITSPFSTGR